MSRTQSSFTLIELLVVVAVVSILSTIALPNFLEAQTRAKVARVKSDQRSVATALEAYAVDNNAYPILRLQLVIPGAFPDRGFLCNAVDLSTPVSYLGSVDIQDPFSPPDRTNTIGLDVNSLLYMNITATRAADGLPPSVVRYLLFSFGPDCRQSAPPYPPGFPEVSGSQPGGYLFKWLATNDPALYHRWIHGQYDPTNGTVSAGEIIRIGP